MPRALPSLIDNQGERTPTISWLAYAIITVESDARMSLNKRSKRFGEVEMREMDIKRLDEIIDKYKGQDGILIQLLLDLQNEFNWIPKEAVMHLSERLRVPKSRIYRTASFYKAMNLSPVGRHVVQVCMGTACQVRGAQRILDLAESRLKIKQGGTTPDMAFSLKRVNCMGCCAMGPVVVVDKDHHGGVTSEGVDEIIGQYD